MRHQETRRQFWLSRKQALLSLPLSLLAVKAETISKLINTTASTATTTTTSPLCNK